ncbi:MAG: MBL fold metallo-hydrolase [Deltaproteobacteria bacterium]|nr:MBL fold metallo-hydrolase [Deltaproteobacteria bacterium]
MQITFWGATRTVTGSCFSLEHGRSRFLVDCGMFQGAKDIEKRNLLVSKYQPQTLQYILLTHAHMDHAGLIPKVVKEGFKGKIICTRATFELCRIMLRDSAHIQEMEAEWQTRKNIRSGLKPVEPLYTIKDAERSLNFFQPVDPGECLMISPDLEICFHKAGHILGASILDIRFEEKGRKSRVVFSGDIGRREALIVPDPDIIEEADFLLVESTYGNRQHKSLEESKSELLSAILEGIKNQEKIIIPAFAIERTQELLYILHEFRKNGKYPSIPVFLDSPLAISATEIFKKHPEYFDEDMIRLLDQGETPLAMSDLKYSRTAEESVAINQYKGPAIVIAASGMCNAGRIKHHLKHNLWRSGAQIVITGFQAEGTLGRSIVEGAKKVRIFQEDVVVRARVHTINGFSAHADQDELLSWIGNFKNPHLTIFVIHGEESTSLAFAEAIQRAFPFQVQVPHWQETIPLLPPKEKAAEKPSEAAELQTLLASLKDRLQAFDGQLGGAGTLEKEKMEEIKAFLKNTESNLNRLMR